jgi:hypothetical protein
MTVKPIMRINLVNFIMCVIIGYLLIRRYIILSKLITYYTIVVILLMETKYYKLYQIYKIFVNVTLKKEKGKIQIDNAKPKPKRS